MTSASTMRLRRRLAARNISVGTPLTGVTTARSENMIRAVGREKRANKQAGGDGEVEEADEALDRHHDVGAEALRRTSGRSRPC